MIVSTASTWQKNGRIDLETGDAASAAAGARSPASPASRSGSAGAARRRRVADLVDDRGRVVLLLGVAESFGVGEHDLLLLGASAACRLRGFGTGVISADRRRPWSGGLFVGCPSLSRSWWRLGISYGELRIGCSKNVSATALPQIPTPARQPLDANCSSEGGLIRSSGGCNALGPIFHNFRGRTWRASGDRCVTWRVHASFLHPKSAVLGPNPAVLSCPSRPLEIRGKIQNRRN